MLQKIQSILTNTFRFSSSEQPISPTAPGKRAQPTAIRSGSLKSRSIAKGFGGKALRGTKRQKEWGEDVRASILKQVSHNSAEALCAHERMQSAQFWINNRDRATGELVEFARKA